MNHLLNFFLAQLKSTAYQPKFVEEKIDVNCPSKLSSKNEYYSMLFPPPNVTGNIHLGHSLTTTIQDVLIRWKRKQNIETLWIPGTDHAGIATQVVVEKILYKEHQKTRHDIGREEFLNQVWKWKTEKGSTIMKDLKKLGTSFNWEREYFTMDKNLSHAVNEAFVQLFEKGLIYRDKSLINWSCSLESAISDVEVDSLDINGPTEIVVPNYDKNIIFGRIMDIAYKIHDSEEEIIVSTTRPETLLGDVAVAVHPNDNRYMHLRDKFVYHQYRKVFIPIIFDESVDPEFGTGAVKITPAHDKNDFDIAKRHSLPDVQVVNEKGLICDGFFEFSGLPRFTARDRILDDLAEMELLRGTRPHNMILPMCSRSKDVIEFLLRPQWFVKCEKMSARAVQAVEQGELKINPPTFEKEWNRWLTNCRDWCISRQLWWGHQIPAYKVEASGKDHFWIAAHSELEARTKAIDKLEGVTDFTIKQDQDVLDTWFSSALLPFSVFNWPSTEADFEKFYPLSLMETGHDILFFWVARMVMLSQELTGKVPFKEVLLHGIICDAYGRKMSKSLGNVILPEQIVNGATLNELRNETEKSVKLGIMSQSELEKSLDGQKKMYPYGIKECGTDALRFTLCSYNIKNHFISFDIVDCHTNKLFFNKIWQATRYSIQFADRLKLNVGSLNNVSNLKLSEMDLWILSRLGNTLKIVNSSLEDYNFHLATAALKTFFYSNLCDVYLETTKVNLTRQNQEAVSNCHVLNICLAIGLDNLEIFAPFLTMELKKYVTQDVKVDLMKFVDDKLEERVEDLLEICSNIRQLKSRWRLTKKLPTTVCVLIKSNDHAEFIENNQENIKFLTFSDDIKLTTSEEEFENESFIGKSTAGHLCSFGIRTLNSENEFTKIESSVNHRKLMKLENDLDHWLKAVNKEGYQKSANPSVQKKHLEKINKLKLEVENMKRI